MTLAVSYYTYTDYTNTYNSLEPNGGLLINQPLTLFTIAASGALQPSLPGTIFITAGSAAALTLGAPVAATATLNGDDGKEILLVSTTAFAHTLTATGLLATGAAAVNVATFAAHPGASLRLKAYQGLWYVIASVGVTFS